RAGHGAASKGRNPPLFGPRFRDREREPSTSRARFMTSPVLDLLLTRRSVSANSLAEPGPDAAELELMLRAASRVPDHKKLAPWRFVLFQGEARAEFGKVLARVCGEEE